MKSAIDLLVDDHKEVKKLLTELVKTTTQATKKRKELLDKIEAELKLHTELEEEIFYPAFREAVGKEHEMMFYEAIEEHRAVEKLVIPDLKKTDPGSEMFSGRAKVLKELVEHHADEEEEEMFVVAKSKMSKGMLQELGKLMEERKP